MIDYYYIETDNVCNKEFVKHVLNKIVKKNNIEWKKLNKNNEIIKLIKNYIIHKSKKIQEGGSNKKNIDNEPKYVVPKTIKLPSINSIKKIGSFNISNKVAVGEFYYSILKLRAGIYNIYLVDDNLMILNSDLKIKPTKKITSWEWKHSGKSVDVDGGTFGFFDLNTVQKINKILNEKKPMKNTRVPLIEIDFDKDHTMVSGSRVEDLKDTDKKKFGTFGVIASTQIGDGAFECYVIDNDCAILIGGYTGDKLFWTMPQK
jgi:hypothetical protein